ncbi:MAG: YqcI/YcgG family protein, partial [Lapillicoccus sp.]
MTSDLETTDASAVAGVRALIGQPDYPCLGARSVFNQDRATVRVFARLGGDGVALEVLRELDAFARSTDVNEGFASFVAVFR